MGKKVPAFLIFVLCGAMPLLCRAQSPGIEKLLKTLETTPSDTLRINKLTDLVGELIKTDNYDLALPYSKEALDLSIKLKFPIGYGRSLNQLGNIYQEQGNYTQALNYYQLFLKAMQASGDQGGISAAYNNISLVMKAQGNYVQALDYLGRSLKLDEKSGNQLGAAQTMINIASIYNAQGDYAKAIEYHTKSLAIFEKSGSQKGVSSALNNIGNFYHNQHQTIKAIEFHTRSLEIRRAIGDKKGIGSSLHNLGNAYESQKEYPKAIEYLTQSLNIRESIGDKQGIASTLSVLGSVYKAIGAYPKAFEYASKSLKIRETIGDKRGLASSLSAISAIYQAQNNPAEAISYAKRSMKIAQELGNVKLIKTAAELQHECYKVLNRPDSALISYELFIKMRDSLDSEENQRAILQQEFKYEYAKKELAIQKELDLAALRFEFEKKQAAVRTEKEKQALRFEEQLKRAQLEADYKERQLTLEAEQSKKTELAKVEQDKKDAVAQAEIRRKELQRNAFIGGFALMLLLAIAFFTQRNRINKEQKRSEELLLNILPQEVANQLKSNGKADATLIEMVTVMFTDFQGFTQLSEAMSPNELVQDLNECFSAFDHICEQYGIEKIKTIGDAYMAAGGLPTPNQTHSIDVVRAALQIRDFMQNMKDRKIKEGLPFFEIRIGIHTGPVVAGIVGVKKFQYDIWGDTVNSANRLESACAIGKVNISQTTFERVKDQFECTPRGKVEVKGKGALEMYFVENRVI